MPNLTNRSNGRKGKSCRGGTIISRTTQASRSKQINKNRIRKQEDVEFQQQHQENLDKRKSNPKTQELNATWLTKLLAVQSRHISKENQSNLTADISNCSTETQDQPIITSCDCSPVPISPNESKYMIESHSKHLYESNQMKTKGFGSRNMTEYGMHRGSRKNSWGHFVDFCE